MEILTKIGFEWHMALANLVNFLIIFWILKKYAFAPIKKVLKERSDKINQGLEDAKKAETELTMARQNAESAATKARSEAQAIVTKAHDQAKAMLAKGKAETESATKALVTEAKELIAKEKRQMEQGLQEKTVEIALEVSEKILREKLDEKKDKVLIEKILSN